MRVPGDLDAIGLAVPRLLPPDEVQPRVPLHLANRVAHVLRQHAPLALGKEAGEVVQRGLEAYRKRDFVSAIALLRKALKTLGDDGDTLTAFDGLRVTALSHMGHALRETKDTEGAIGALNRVEASC